MDTLVLNDNIMLVKPVEIDVIKEIGEANKDSTIIGAKRESSLVLPASAYENREAAYIVQLPESHSSKLELKVGDKVILPAYQSAQGQNIKLNREQFRLAQCTDVMCIIVNKK